MSMTKVDDRTEEQKKTHKWAVVGTDSFLSGWGGARGGFSYAAWAVKNADDAWEAEKMVRRRSDMKRVRTVFLPSYRPGRGCVHFHIYVFEPEYARNWGKNDRT